MRQGRRSSQKPGAQARTKAADQEAPARAREKGRTLDLGELNDVLGWWLTAAFSSVQADFISRFEPLGLAPAQYAILTLVERNPGCRQGDIGKALGVTHTNLAQRVEALVARGFIDRKPHLNDGRANVLRLTESGHLFLKEAQRVHQKHEAQFASRFRPAEYRALVRHLRELGRDRRPNRFGEDE
jgi:DNA-binding MarR family transcriptional regulator